MSGILDNKSRVIDTLITTEGRRQLSLGGIDIKYLSFTDNAAFYRADIASGSQDATRRIYLEACQLPQDMVSFQADDSGNLQTFDNTVGTQIAGGQILEYSFQALTQSTIGGSVQSVSTLTGSSFTDASHVLLASAASNFANLQLIATHDRVFEDDGFGIGPDKVTFVISNTRPIPTPAQQTANVSLLDSIFSDPRFSDRPNFRYLPPINKTTDASLDKTDPRATRSRFLGFFQPWGRTQVFGLTYQQTMNELAYYDSLGFRQTISFDPTSASNHLVGQFFEASSNTLRKLDVIDYGVHQTGNPSSPTAHIFFVGKVEVDEKGTDTFLHVFTLVFE